MRTDFGIKHFQILENGIMLYANSNENTAAIATIDRVGNIKADWFLVKKYRKEHKKLNCRSLLHSLLTVIILSIFTFSVFFHMQPNIRNLIRLLLFVHCCCIFSVILYRPKVKLKINSATHMLVNAYNDLRRTPSIEELRNYSEFINFSSTNELVIIAITKVLVFAYTYIPNPIIASVVILTFGKFTLTVLSYYGFLNIFQIFSTIKPTDTELMLVISALNVWIENEGYKEG